MKKLLTIILALAICLVPLTGCSNSLGSAKLSGVQDTDFVVHNNGSAAVQYGDYLYFVNGYRGYDDTDGKNNVFNNVTKGGLYRVPLFGAKSGREFESRENPIKDNFTGLHFKDYAPYVVDSNDDNRYLDENDYEKYLDLVNFGSAVIDVEKTVKDDDGNDTEEKETVEETFVLDDMKFEVRGVERLSGKTIGTSGYAEGGIYIFDDFVYYASPNNEQNKTGTIQTSLTDFFATKIDGSATYKLYTSENNTSSSPYGFYKYGDNVYLTVLDGTDLVSVKIADGKKKEVNKIAEKVNSAVMPINKTYDASSHNENDVSEFVYISRAAGDGDVITSGTIIEYMRPDGTERNHFLTETESCNIVSVSDGLVYYRITDTFGTTSLHYTNLSAITGEPEFTGALISNVSDYSSLYIFRNKNAFDDKNNSVFSDTEIFVIGKTSGGLYVINDENRLKISNSSGDVFGIYENMVYFRNGATIVRCNIAVPAGENTDETLFSNVGTSGLLPTVCNGMLVYFGDYDSLSNYTNIYFVDSQTNQFVGEVSKADLTTDEETEE